ncbi:hypothetical protein B0H19DRAFT_1255181 [Mycena capillaripes]|nr:hypothetical protein B0H19DRAFT_1255181 [Mycena capillaripes]
MSHRKPPGQPPDDVALRYRGGATRHRMLWEPPGGYRWLTANSLLAPLSDSAALQVFMDIADANHDDACVAKLLTYTGNLPLAVSLMANVAAYEGCGETLSRWEIVSTRVLSDGYDQRSSLDLSIMLSYSSPRMNSGAQDLLDLLSMLPDGFQMPT